MSPAESVDHSHFLARFAAFVSLTVGLFVVAGWTLDMEPLTNIVPGWPRMTLLTAVAYMLAGMALWLTTLRLARFAIPTAGLVTAIGLLVIIRDVTGWNAHLEQLSLGPFHHRE